MHSDAPDAPSPKQKCFGMIVFETADGLRSLLERKLKTHGLSLPSWATLHALQAQEGHGLTQAELARLVYIEEPTLVPRLQGMERKGYIHKRTDLQDRRCKRVYISATASALLEEIDRDMHEELRQIFHGTNGQMKDVADAFMRDFHARLRDHARLQQPQSRTQA